MNATTPLMIGTMSPTRVSGPLMCATGSPTPATAPATSVTATAPPTSATVPLTNATAPLTTPTERGRLDEAWEGNQLSSGRPSRPRC